MLAHIDQRMALAQQVLNCSFDHWHQKFKAVSFRSQSVSLPKQFVEYLVEDGVYLSEGNAAVRSCSDTVANCGAVAG